MEVIIRKLTLFVCLIFPLVSLAKATPLEILGKQRSAATLSAREIESSRIDLQNQLAGIEEQISQLDIKTQETKRNINVEKRAINQLCLEENQLNRELTKQKHTLHKQVALSYRIKNKTLLRSLLERENLNEQEKANRYAQHLNQSQVELTQHIARNIDTLCRIKEKRQTLLNALEKLYATQQQEQAQLEKQLKARQLLLAQL